MTTSFPLRLFVALGVALCQIVLPASVVAQTVAPVNPTPPVAYFMQVVGLTGNAVDPNHSDWFQATSWKLHAGNPGIAILMGPGGGSGRASITDLTVVLPSSLSVEPILIGMLNSGAAQHVVVDAVDGIGAIVSRYDLTGARLSGYTTSGGSTVLSWNFTGLAGTVRSATGVAQGGAQEYQLAHFAIDVVNATASTDYATPPSTELINPGGVATSSQSTYRYFLTSSSAEFQSLKPAWVELESFSWGEFASGAIPPKIGANDFTFVISDERLVALFSGGVGQSFGEMKLAVWNEQLGRVVETYVLGQSILTGSSSGSSVGKSTNRLASFSFASIVVTGYDASGTTSIFDSAGNNIATPVPFTALPSNISFSPARVVGKTFLRLPGVSGDSTDTVYSALQDYVQLESCALGSNFVSGTSIGGNLSYFLTVANHFAELTKLESMAMPVPSAEFVVLNSAGRLSSVYSIANAKVQSVRYGIDSINPVFSNEVGLGWSSLTFLNFALKESIYADIFVLPGNSLSIDRVAIGYALFDLTVSGAQTTGTVNLSVSSGRLTFNGQIAPSVTMTASIDQINAELQKLIYTPNTGFTGKDALHVDFTVSGNTNSASGDMGLQVNNSMPADAPTSVTAVAGNGFAVVNFSAPLYNGGTAVTQYTAISSDGGSTASCNAPCSSILVRSLINGQSYAFSVAATNGAGVGVASGLSNSVLPNDSATFVVSTAHALHGSVSPEIQVVASGNAASFTIATDDGYTANASGCGGSLIGNTYSTGLVTTDCMVDVTFALSTTKLDMLQGWNLMGNSLNLALAVVPAFADTAVVTTVWKWDPVIPGWQFYTPMLTSSELQAYATNKGYGVLSVINPGEGYWVNAKVSATLSTQTGTAFALASGNLVTGWNLVAIGNDLTPSAFNISMSATPPSPGTIPINLTTLWAWENTLSKWYFYAPSLEASGGLTAYITGKGYLDFAQNTKTLGNGTGFWVNWP